MTMDDANEWSVLRANLLAAAVDEIIGPDATSEQVCAIRVLFNTWEHSGILTVAEDAKSAVWKQKHAEWGR